MSFNLKEAKCLDFELILNLNEFKSILCDVKGIKWISERN